MQKEGAHGNTEAFRSYRYGDGVSYEAHALYLKQLGMDPERNADGSWIGFDPKRQDPLRDSSHPLFSKAKPGDEQPTVSTVDAAA